ncbi:MAG: aminoacyl-tRNA hydrolase [Deltaproteobacteria bacterium]
MQLVVGLGNPGPSYRNHRHNVGFMVVERLHARIGASEWREKFRGLAGRGLLAGRETHLLLPQTFMNLSGESVQRAVTQLGVKPADILVVHDDLDLPFGDVRVKVAGGHGGHNGLRDITRVIGADYLRVRVGIGRPTVGTVEHYVLSPFTKEESAELEGVIARAVEAIEGVVSEGPSLAMNKTNTKPKKKPQ